ncbi:hypothetical protein EPUS_07705 [Endocarpon pusillum Z07020]|uniref:F-box domain-containing protein n=1 Tax=Endocarpon pusillum (strain Z07020 / HMAS-L-300199) TaxID=1263415 RepID=U1GKT5_ENDPU|nr:uncharacterized protein EPUS_07705 [Endocarpon pusillum Z07020]ERF72496.1 hypothetical protein EPUS_07705 [Endocarpon pusillum Z07020]
MDRISPEILSIIVGYLYSPPPEATTRMPWDDPPPPPTFVPYACISRQWQLAVEAHTFSTINLSSDELDQFSEIFSNVRRRGYLKSIEYDVLLSTYSEGWEESRGPSRLRLKAYSPMDMGSRSYEADPGLEDERTEGHFLEFPDDSKSLPVVPRITSFELEGSGCRHLHLDAVGKILAAIPQVERLDLRLYEPKMKREAMRRDHRNALAQTFTRLSPLPSLRTLHLHYESREPLNHSFNPGDLRSPNQTVDGLSIALHTLSSSPGSVLKELYLSGPFILSPHPFWPPHDEESTNEKLSPSTLQRVTIESSVITPEGTWYYTGDPASVPINTDELRGADDPDSDSDSESDSDSDSNSNASTDSLVPDSFNARREALLNGDIPSHNWRTQLDAPHVDSLISAIARGVQNMPDLKGLSLKMGLQLQGFSALIVEVLDAGEELRDPPVSGEVDGMGKRRFKVWVGSETSWEMDENVKGEMRRSLGEDGVVTVETWPADP